MNIIKRELRANMKSLIIWSGCMIALIAMMISEFSAYYQNDEMGDILDQFGDMLKAFGMSGSGITTVGGFLSLAAIYLYLIPSVYAGISGSAIISKEERDKTTEFFLVLPISREKAILGKLIAAIINNLILNAVTIGSTILLTMQYDKEPGFSKFMLLMTLAIFMLQMIFMSIGMLLSSIMKRYKRSGMMTSSILLGMYLISIFSNISPDLDNLKYITPFRYYEAGYLLQHAKIDLVYIIITFGIVITSIVGTFYFYPRRDVRI